MCGCFSASPQVELPVIRFVAVSTYCEEVFWREREREGEAGREAMAVCGKKVLLVTLLAALLVASTQAAVTVVNLAQALRILVNGANVDVKTGSVSVDVKGAKSQDIVVKGPDGKDIKVNVKDGDVLVLVPNILGNGGIIVNVNGVQTP